MIGFVIILLKFQIVLTYVSVRLPTLASVLYICKFELASMQLGVLIWISTLGIYCLGNPHGNSGLFRIVGGKDASQGHVCSLTHTKTFKSLH